MIAAINSSVATNDIHINKIKEHSASDDQYTKLTEFIITGFPSHKDEVPTEITEFWQIRNDLYTIDGVVFSAGRPLIPRRMRPSLEDLHIGHQGVNAMKINARQRLFWSHMSKHIQQVRNNCRRCNEIAPKQGVTDQDTNARLL